MFISIDHKGIVIFLSKMFLDPIHHPLRGKLFFGKYTTITVNVEILWLIIFACKDLNIQNSSELLHLAVYVCLGYASASIDL